MQNLQEEKSRIEDQIAELYRQREELKYRISRSGIKREPSDLGELIKDALENTPEIFPTHATVACQGIEGAYSQIAAERLFKYPWVMHFKNFGAIFEAIEQGLCEYGILPIENSTAGSVNQIYDLMTQHSFYICRSVRIKIEHNLLVKPGVDIGQINEVCSHGQAIGQCEKFLDSLGVKVTSCSNTAAAAKMVAESERDDIAAISSKECAGIYGLAIAKEDIQDMDNNYTRFICISKRPEVYPGADKSSIMAVLPHRPGSLCMVLNKVADAGFNLSKLESRPIPNRDFEFMFYFDFEASVYDDRFTEVIIDLESFCEKFEYLGSYTETI